MAKVVKLKRYLAYDYNKIDFETKINVLMMLTSNNENLEDDNDHYENFPIPLVKEDQINKVLAKMFVYCNLPFSLIEYPFFIEFIKILCTTYNLLNYWVLIETLIIQKISRIALKVIRIINEENNLTIAFDG
ncbi:hypothetical protein RhiirA4_471431 [Rhizophagus irregularis]|uniref:Uncharacterized protein n=1 Tax=Rhizophagus irregularis TaxID=588596 RepID=A0A2I1H3A2_9GLOM|nr:hypothetical protein RhiirA4_471431 [Rhizophagus irregularis]